ncbi:MAG: GDP-mannose 4,6-dehydratase [Dehalococcoidales bacterium]
MNWNKHKVLVTGATGFIGSHLVERLLSLGAQVRVFAQYNSQNSTGLLEILPDSVRKEVEVVWGDIKEMESVKKGSSGSSIIFHLASLVGIPYSYLHPQEVVMTNTIGALNVLICSREDGVEKTVITSTSEVYGTARYIPIDENHPLQGQSPYSASKIAADKLAESFYCSYNLPVAICRPFNTYGPRQSMRAVIPTIITQALTKDEIRLGSITPTRDLNFVLDTVAGFIRIAESPRSVGEVINIGSGFEISIGDLAAKICSLVGKDLPIVSEEHRKRPKKSEVSRLYADNRKAKELIGWEPRVSLDEGLKQTIDWISSSLKYYQPDKYYV